MFYVDQNRLREGFLYSHVGEDVRTERSEVQLMQDIQIYTVRAQLYVFLPWQNFHWSQ